MELVKYSGFKEEFIKKSYGNSARAAIVAALPGSEKQTLKSQIRDRLLIIKLGTAWCCLMGRINIIFLAVFFTKKSVSTIKISIVVWSR